jgi:predicted RNase H-like HicB family nuclease
MSEPHQGFHVWIAWDDEASVWYVRDSDLPGLVAEGETVDALREKLLPRVKEIAALNQHLFRHPL